MTYIKLTESFSKILRKTFKPIESKDRLILDSTKNISICSVAGYPASKGKKKQNVYQSEIFSFTGKNVPGEIYDKHDLSDEINIVLHFNRKTAVYPDTGELFPTPGLKGVSGGGIFAWPADKPFECDWSERKLIGIFHTFKEKDRILIGTTMLPFLSALTLGHMKGFGGY